MTTIKGLAPYYPIESAERLMKILLPCATPATPTGLRKGKRHYDFIVGGVPVLYLMADGIHVARRRSDNKIVGTFVPPVILGWSSTHAHIMEQVGDNGYSYLDTIFLERQDAGQLLTLPLSDAYRIVQEQNCLLDVVLLLSYHINHLLRMGGDVADTRARTVVMIMLRRLIEFPEDLRREYTVVKFIEERTTLSRSTILRELNVARQDGIVVMENGKLMKFTNAMEWVNN
jgi:hypothetical protein